MAIQRIQYVWPRFILAHSPGWISASEEQRMGASRTDAGPCILEEVKQGSSDWKKPIKGLSKKATELDFVIHDDISPFTWEASSG